MYQIIAHVKPKKESDKFNEVKGAYAVLFINYKDIDGAFELAKYYIQDDEWEIIELEEEYFVIEKKDEMPDDYEQFYDEVFKYGFSLIFNTYETDEEE